MALQLVDQAPVEGRRCLMRVDFNVPLQDGQIADDMRIQAALPTIKQIIERGGRLILLSHLGRPKGQVVPEFSLRPVAAHLSQLLGQEVHFVPEPVGPEAEAAAARLKDGEVLLLENVRFLPGETKGDEQLARQWADLGDLYVNEAFGVSHRKHTSVYYLPKQFEREQRYAGPLLMKEMVMAHRLMEEPLSPYVVVLGGAKVSDKVGLLHKLLTVADKVLIGGAMAHVFYKAIGFEMGASYYDRRALPVARSLLRKYRDRIELPSDFVVLDGEEVRVVSAAEVQGEMKAMDIGPKTVDEWLKWIDPARKIFWNGPMGVFEDDRFALGTKAVGMLLVQQAEKGALVVIGGGDTAAAARKFGIADKVTHVSTGGGAMLELLEKGTLPGIQVLTE